MLHRILCYFLNLDTFIISSACSGFTLVFFFFFFFLVITIYKNIIAIGLS